jgi:hypothetical protein
MIDSDLLGYVRVEDNAHGRVEGPDIQVEVVLFDVEFLLNAEGDHLAQSDFYFLLLEFWNEFSEAYRVDGLWAGFLGSSGTRRPCESQFIILSWFWADCSPLP